MAVSSRQPTARRRRPLALAAAAILAAATVALVVARQESLVDPGTRSAARRRGSFRLLASLAEPALQPVVAEAEAKSRKRASRQAKKARKHAEAAALLSALSPPPRGHSRHFAAESPEQPQSLSLKPLALDWGALPAAVDPQRAAYAFGKTKWGGQRGVRPKDDKRFARKQRQVEVFAALLGSILDASEARADLTVVDFGCSSGNLLLPLAAAFPETQFVGVDLKRSCLPLLESRAAAANLTNVKTWCGLIQDYVESGQALDVAIGLHVCGEAADHVVEAAVQRQAPFVVAPCCIGKVNNEAWKAGHAGEIRLPEGEPYRVRKLQNGSAVVEALNETATVCYAKRLLNSSKNVGFDLFRVVLQWSDLNSHYYPKLRREFECNDVPVLTFLLDAEAGAEQTFDWRPDVILYRFGSGELSYPRSEWLSTQVTKPEFAQLARLADFPESSHESRADLFYKVKTVVTLDRGLWAEDRGYHVDLRRMAGLGEEYAKDDILVGYPPRREEP
eukprot:TRINITY_DN38098_c0_g1_i1.p1 TRINITY_DN38098_c0_g1~~TRINITY_DN38098_c0_g1_i1.p1  ORF type:complete len:538 (-),score=114.66 TRINITY_DN38098_c0_g1_i1:565-2079(-)